MVVGLATVRLRLPEAATLKDKRSLRSSVTARVRNRFNVAVAEVGEHDARGSLTLGIACVSTDAGHAHAVLETVVRSIARQRLDADMIDYDIEML